jgi:hypothetical protein
MKIASRIARNDFTCTAFTLLHRLRDIVKDAAASGERSSFLQIPNLTPMFQASSAKRPFAVGAK